MGCQYLVIPARVAGEQFYPSLRELESRDNLSFMVRLQFLRVAMNDVSDGG